MHMHPSNSSEFLKEPLSSLNVQIDSRVTLRSIVESAFITSDASTAAITLLDSSRTSLDFVAVAGTNADQMLGQRVLVRDSITGQTALTGQPRIYFNEHKLTEAACESPENLILTSTSITSAAVVPVILDGVVQGALAVINKQDGTGFTQDEIDRLKLLADVAGSAMRIERLQVNFSRSHRERDIVYSTAKATASTLNVHAVLQDLLRTLSLSMDVSWAVALLMNEDKTTLSAAATWNLPPGSEEWNLDLNSPFAFGLVSQTPFRIFNEMANEGSVAECVSQAQSFLSSPIISRSVLCGAILIGSNRASAYDYEDGALLEILASQAAIALENTLLHEDATRMAREASALYNLSTTVNLSLDVEYSLSVVADTVLNLLQVDRFACYMFNAKARRLEIKESRNIPAERLKDLTYATGEGVVGWVHANDTPAAIADMATPGQLEDHKLAGLGIDSLVAVPMQISRSIGGVLIAMCDRSRQFTVSEIELMCTIANQISTGISNAALYRDLKRNSEKLKRTVRKLSHTFGAARDATETSQSIVELVQEIMDAERAVLYLCNDDGQVELTAWTGSNRHAWPTKGCTAERIVRKKRSIGIRDLSNSVDLILPPFVRRESLLSYLGVPLKIGSSILGVVEVYGKSGRHFASEDARLLTAFASQATLGIQNSMFLSKADRRLDDLKVIGRVSERLCARAQPRDLCREAIALICEGTDSDIGCVVFTDSTTPIIYRSASNDPAYPVTAEHTNMLTEEVYQWLAAYSRSSDADVSLASVNGSAIGVTLSAGSRASVFGAVVVCRLPNRPLFDQFDQKLLQTIGNLLVARVHDHV